MKIKKYSRTCVEEKKTTHFRDQHCCIEVVQIEIGRVCMVSCLQMGQVCPSVAAAGPSVSMVRVLGMCLNQGQPLQGADH